MSTRPVRLLYSRAASNFASDPPEPVGEYRGGIDFAERQWLSVSRERGQLVSVPKWELRVVEIPEWLPVAAWVKSWRLLERAAQRGVNLSWPEAWVRGLLKLQPLEQYVGATLLSTRTFRNAARREARDALVTWLEAPVGRAPFNASEMLTRDEAAAFRRAEKKRTK